MSRRAGRRDANHAAVRDDLRAAGFCVVDLGSVGDGVPDLLVSRGGQYPGAMPPPPESRGALVSTGAWYAVEVKGRGGRLEPAQAEWIWRARGPVIVAETAEDVIEAIEAMTREVRR